jgi:hypothetical protein
MKKVFMAMISMVLLLLPLAVYAQSENSSKEAPPVSQALIPEGDFALKLVPAIGLGTPDSEAQAEDMLTSVGIAPRNGWIADYPVTPDIMGELQNGVATAADSKKLPMGKDDALKAFQDLATEFGLGVVPGGSGQYVENQPRPDPTIINDYYYEEGPPVVTYYPPPWDYYYLYAWVPYPFWWGGFYFSGFFCLHDFHRVVLVGHHRFLVTNHVINPINKTVVRVNPVSRRTGTGLGNTDISHHRGFNSSEARRGAASIFERDRGQAFTRLDNKTSTFSGSGENGTLSRSMTGRTMTQPGNIERSFQRPSTGETRGFSVPGRGNERSFGVPSTRSYSFGSSESRGRSFSAPGRSFSAPSGGSSSSCANCHGGSSSFGRGGGGSSSGGFSGGHSSGGFSGGGFSGGHGGGGGRGR